MSNMLTVELKELFTPSRKGLLLAITIGNRFRSDDGVGPFIARQIKKSKKNVIVINAEDKPENIIDRAIQLKPCKVVIIDAANFGGIPGEIRLIEKNNVPDTSLSTHSLSPNILAAIIEADTGADVFFLGIQPKSIQLTEGLAEPVKKSAEKIISCIRLIE
jgi:hydrogenase maturation protease HycI